MPFKFLNDPRLAGLVSAVETAAVLAVATFLLNLAAALAAFTNGQPFVFNWRVNEALAAASLLGAIGKGLLAFIGARAADAKVAPAPPPGGPQ